MSAPQPMWRLSSLYFTAVALALVLVHLSVYVFLTEKIESRFAVNRIDRAFQAAQALLDQGQRPVEGVLQLGESVPEMEEVTRLYFEIDKWPADLPPMAEIPVQSEAGIFYEPSDHSDDRLLQRRELGVGAQMLPAVVVIDNSTFEISEDQVDEQQLMLLAVSAVLLLFSVLVVLALARRLAKPLSELTEQLAQRDPGDLSSLPDRHDSAELAQLVETFNLYQARIAAMIERERGFNRYLSHELRTPLMVVQGATSLLAVSQEPKLVLRQQARLARACDEMREFTDTLLSLSRYDRNADALPWSPTESELLAIAESHSHLIEGRPVQLCIAVCEPVELLLTRAAFSILLGNLVKNALVSTESGEVVISLKQSGLCVEDTGHGLGGRDDAQSQGFGLGLLLVRDICHRESWIFSLDERKSGGCVAEVAFGTQPNRG